MAHIRDRRIKSESAISAKEHLNRYTRWITGALATSVILLAAIVVYIHAAVVAVEIALNSRLLALLVIATLLLIIGAILYRIYIRPALRRSGKIVCCVERVCHTIHLYYRIIRTLF